MRISMLLMIIVLLGALTYASAPMPRAKSTQTGFLFDSIEAEGRTYGFVTYVPRAHDGSEAMPLILYLHGKGESGTDGQRQLVIGLPPRLNWDPERWPFIILMPQKPDGDSQWEDHERAIRAMLDATVDRFNIDESRVYLTGLSQGGHGTWTINAAMPGRFAALAPVCGYGEFSGTYDTGRSWPENPDSTMTRSILDAARNVPVWAFHGEEDRTVPASQSRFLVDQLHERGGDARLTIYPGVAHNSWDNAYAEPGLAAWLLSHRLP